MTIVLSPLTPELLTTVLEQIPDLERARRIFPRGWFARGQSPDEWVKDPSSGHLLAILADGTCLGYGVLTPPALPALVANLSTVLVPTEEAADQLPQALEALASFAFRHHRTRKLVYEAVASEQCAVSAALAAGFREEVVFDEAVFSDGQYWALIRFGLLREVRFTQGAGKGA